jgi:predicted DNA-binding transcriptional regulator AlpA
MQVDPLVWEFPEVCARLRISLSTGERRRRMGDWPPAIRLGQRRLYRPADVEAWLTTKLQTATDQTPAPSCMAV